MLCLNNWFSMKYFAYMKTLKFCNVIKMLYSPVVKDRWKTAVLIFFQTQRRFASSAAQWGRYQCRHQKSGKPWNPAARRNFQRVCAFCRSGCRSCSYQLCSAPLRSCLTRLPCRLWAGKGGKAFWILQFVFGLSYYNL